MLVSICLGPRMYKRWRIALQDVTLYEETPANRVDVHLWLRTDLLVTLAHRQNAAFCHRDGVLRFFVSVFWWTIEQRVWSLGIQRIQQ